MMKTVLIAISILITFSCATIVGQKNQTIAISGTPDQARVTITDEKQVVVFEGNTPAKVLLDKADGRYFGGKTYQVKIDKVGYQPVKMTVNSELGGWYLFGNFVFGGLIGWLIVDPFSGAMYDLSPEKIDVQLLQGGKNSSLSPDCQVQTTTVSPAPPNTVLFPPLPIRPDAVPSSSPSLQSPRKPTRAW
jgi:hypothetical protein